MLRMRYRLRRFGFWIRNITSTTKYGRWYRRQRLRRQLAASSDKRLGEESEAMGSEWAVSMGEARRRAVANLVGIYALCILVVGIWFAVSRGFLWKTADEIMSKAAVSTRSLLASLVIDSDAAVSLISSAIPDEGDESLTNNLSSIKHTPQDAIAAVLSSLGIKQGAISSMLMASLPGGEICRAEASEGVVIAHVPKSSEDEKPASSQTESLSADVKKTATTKVIIYHTHTSETYKDEGCAYLWQKYNPNFDLEYIWKNKHGVVTAGTALAEALNAIDIGVVHSKKVHDYPCWSDSYKTALPTIQEMVLQENEARVVLDIHRDGLSDTRSTSTVDGQTVARITIVVTSDRFGLPHPGWKENYDFALHLSEAVNSAYPGLCRGVQLRHDARWNQHVHPHAIIIEVGSNLNTTEEAVATAKLLAKPLSTLL